MMRHIVWVFWISLCVDFYAQPSRYDQLQQAGYAEIYPNVHDAAAFQQLYDQFDALIDFFQNNSAWARKLYEAQQRFIRSKHVALYGTNFFGLYDESATARRAQISFYYASHFHDFLSAEYPSLVALSKIQDFLDTCCKMQYACTTIFDEIVHELGMNGIITDRSGHMPMLYKVVKYLPSYCATRPHYDGTAFSLFLDSTDQASLLFSAYQSTLHSTDFSVPFRLHGQSMLLIPGAHVTDFNLYPTPHIVQSSGKTRYATIVFGLRPYRDDIPSASFAELPAFTN